MNHHDFFRHALTGSAVILVTTLGRPLAGQTAGPDSIAAQIERSINDSNLVSPISGAPIAPAALRLVGQTITAPTGDTRVRMAQALSRSAVSPRDVDALLASLSALGNAPTAAHVQEATMDFNTFVNMASQSFLSDPPDEFLALHAILLRVASGPEVPATRTRYRQ
jgi:hypothetical protein